MVAPVPVSYCTPSIQGFAFRESVAQQLVVPPIVALDTVYGLDRKRIIHKHVLRVHFAWWPLREPRLLIQRSRFAEMLIRVDGVALLRVPLADGLLPLRPPSQIRVLQVARLQFVRRAVLAAVERNNSPRQSLL